MVGDGFQRLEDLIVCVGFPGEMHSLKEFVTPKQVMVQQAYLGIVSETDDIMLGCWDWVCTQIEYPRRTYNQFTDYHELRAFRMRRLRTVGEYFQMPFQTLVIGLGDCFDKTALLVSLLRNSGATAYGVLGMFRAADVIDHAWAVVERSGRRYILESTLNRAVTWKTEADLPEYSPEVYFNEAEVWSRDGVADSLFCNTRVGCEERARLVRRCWQCSH